MLLVVSTFSSICLPVAVCSWVVGASKHWQPSKDLPETRIRGEEMTRDGGASTPAAGKAMAFQLRLQQSTSYGRNIGRCCRCCRRLNNCQADCTAGHQPQTRAFRGYVARWEQPTRHGSCLFLPRSCSVRGQVESDGRALLLRWLVMVLPITSPYDFGLLPEGSNL